MRAAGRRRGTSATHQLVTRDEDVEGSVLVVRDLLPVPELPERRSILGVAPVRETFELRDEASDLLLPVVESRGGSDDEEGSPDVMDLGKVGHERDRLDGLRRKGKGKRKAGQLTSFVRKGDCERELTFPRPISSARIPLIPCS